MKKVSLLFVALLTFVFFTQPASAYVLLGGKQKSTIIVYYIQSSLTNEYTSNYSSAVKAWNATPTNISIRLHANNNSGPLSVRGGYYGNTDWNAQCTNYKEFIFWGDYVDSIITANYSYMDSMSPELRQGVFAHEIGHALGLDHVTDTTQIMCTSFDGRTAIVPGNDDIDGVNYLY